MNCQRAKRRASLSYETMWTVLGQLSAITNNLSTQTKKHIRESREFVESVIQFLKSYQSCQSNLQWNKIMIEVG